MEQKKATKISDFITHYKLGEGAFSSVYKVTRKSDQKTYAMKKVKMNKLTEKEKKNALNEVRILASIQDYNVIGYKEAFYDENSQSLCIIQEFANGGDIMSLINDTKKKRVPYFNEEQIWDWAISMLKGLKCLHDNNIMHRDLKAANIFLMKDQKTAKLGDLNVSKVTIANQLATTQTGTPYYAAPEIWKDSPYNFKCDIWSFGCVIYEIATLRPPFTANNIEGLYKKIKRGSYERIPPRYSKDLANFVALCLQLNPHNRPDTDSLLQLSCITKRQQLKGNISGASPKNSNNNKSQSLIDTIRVPKNLRQLQDRLPKASYQNQSQADVVIYRDQPYLQRSPRSHSIENNNSFRSGSNQAQRRLIPSNNALKEKQYQYNNNNNNNNNGSQKSINYKYNGRNRAGSLNMPSKNQKPMSPRRIINCANQENNSNVSNNNNMILPNIPKHNVKISNNNSKIIQTPSYNQNNVKIIQYQRQRSARRLKSSDKSIPKNNSQIYNRSPNLFRNNSNNSNSNKYLR